MNAWQNRITSWSLFPFGLKSEPPCAAHRERCQTVLKVCSKARNFSTPRLTVVEPQTALTARRAVHLHPVAAVDLHLAAIVDPGHAEQDHPFSSTIRSSFRLAVRRRGVDDRHDRLDDLPDRLVEFRLPGIPGDPPDP